jgi:hypothetical protein
MKPMPPKKIIYEFTIEEPHNLDNDWIEETAILNGGEDGVHLDWNNGFPIIEVSRHWNVFVYEDLDALIQTLLVARMLIDTRLKHGQSSESIPTGGSGSGEHPSE